VIAGCAKRLRPEDFGQYRHLGLKRAGDDLTIPPPAVPSPKRGPYSRTNVEGKEIVRRDLPKEDRTFSAETPNWGDWSNGSHTVSWTREVYPREFVPAKGLELTMELLDRVGEDCIFKFAIDQVLNRGQANFEDDLLFNLNLLQENVQAIDVFPSAATLAEYTRTIKGTGRYCRPALWTK